MAKKEKFWTKVKVEVVAGLVVLITIEIFTGGWFISTLWKVVKAIGGFLSYPIPLPLWAIVLLPIAGAGAVIGWEALASFAHATGRAMGLQPFLTDEPTVSRSPPEALVNMETVIIYGYSTARNVPRMVKPCPGTRHTYGYSPGDGTVNSTSVRPPGPAVPVLVSTAS